MSRHNFYNCKCSRLFKQIKKQQLPSDLYASEETYNKQETNKMNSILDGGKYWRKIERI